MTCCETLERLLALVYSRFRSLCFLSVVAFYALTAFAIGDSGGCSGFDSREVKAAAEGDAEALLAVIWANVDKEEEQLAWSRRLYFSLSSASRQEWRKSAAKSMADGSPVAFSGSCGNPIRPSLLTVAVWSGNAETTRALLDLGADPNAPRFDSYGRLASHLFLSCDRTTEVMGDKPRRGVVDKQIDALKLVLAAGGNLNLQSAEYFGRKSGTHYCADPEILRFYMENGADPSAIMSGDKTPIETAVYAILLDDFMHRNGLSRFYEVEEERIKALLVYGKVLPRFKVMSNIATRCMSEKNERACAILERLIPGLKSISQQQMSITRLIP